MLRNIYDKPIYVKPKLGRRPEWLDEEEVNLFPLSDLISQIKGSKTEKKQKSRIDEFLLNYIETLKKYYVKEIENGKPVYDCFNKMKRIRDLFLNFLSVIAESECSLSKILCGIFETMHNILTSARGLNLEDIREKDYEIYRIHIWELFICTIVYLRHRKDYKTIHDILTNTYFLTSPYHGNIEETANYCCFRHWSRIIEEKYKPTTEDKDKFALLGKALCEREKLPIYTKEAIAEADLFLYQVYRAYQLPNVETRWPSSEWFPTCYIYAKNSPSEWKKMKSRQFCKNMFDLFGVDSMDEFKGILKYCKYDKGMRYNGSFDAAPAILDCIKLDEIGSVN